MSDSIEERLSYLEALVKDAIIAQRGIQVLEDAEGNEIIKRSMDYVNGRAIRFIMAKQREKEKYEIEQQIQELTERLKDYA